MNDSAVKKMVTDILSGLRFEVSEVETDTDQTPDLRATQSGESFLIEIKEKGDDRDKLSRVQATLDRGAVALQSESVGRRNTLSAVIKKAAAQLRSRLMQDEFGLV